MKNLDLENIDWQAREDSPSEIRRPFTVKVEEKLARAFLKTVKDNGLFVRETLVKLMRAYVNQCGDPSSLRNTDERQA